MILTKANREWVSRPNDQRYKSLAELHRVCLFHKEHSVEQQMLMRELRLEARTSSQIGGATLDQMVLIKGGGRGVGASLNNWSFSQLCNRVSPKREDGKAGGGQLRFVLSDLPTTLAVQVMNHKLARLAADPKRAEYEAKLLIQSNGGLKLRGLTSKIYDRIWDSDITSRLIRLNEQDPCWQPAPAARDGSRGLYASDHDMFAFMVDNDRRIFESKNGGLSRGFFVWNSEVGGKSFGIMTFLYNFVCGNHMVWGATDVLEARIRHVGNASEKAWGAVAVMLKQYAESSVSDDQARIQAAMNFKLGGTKDKVLDAVFGLRNPFLTRSRLEASWDAAEAHSDWYGDPKSAWGFVNGITEHAKSIPYTNARVDVERAGGKVLDHFLKVKEIKLPDVDPELQAAVAKAIPDAELVGGGEGE